MQILQSVLQCRTIVRYLSTSLCSDSSSSSSSSSSENDFLFLFFFLSPALLALPLPLLFALLLAALGAGDLVAFAALLLAAGYGEWEESCQEEGWNVL